MQNIATNTHRCCALSACIGWTRNTACLLCLWLVSALLASYTTVLSTIQVCSCSHKRRRKKYKVKTYCQESNEREYYKILDLISHRVGRQVMNTLRLLQLPALEWYDPGGRPGTLPGLPGCGKFLLGKAHTCPPQPAAFLSCTHHGIPGGELTLAFALCPNKK